MTDTRAVMRCLRALKLLGHTKRIIVKFKSERDHRYMVVCVSLLGESHA